MKLGYSTYCLSRVLDAGEMNLLQVVQWAAEHGGEHVEIASDLEPEPDMADRIADTAARCGLEISNYAVESNFMAPTRDDYLRELARVERQVDIAGRLGVRRMNFDVAMRTREDSHMAQFESDMPVVVETCRHLADYAAQYDIVLSLENHGYHVQSSDRMQRILQAVDRPNFATTLDIGNFLFADEDPVAGVRHNINSASMIHFKDFYRRSGSTAPSENWFISKGGHFLRGAIFGQGDMQLEEIVSIVKQSGYDGYISLEFEGMEECRMAAELSLRTARRMWESI